MELNAKDYMIYPKFRHNLWTNYNDDPDLTYLLVSHGTYEVQTSDVSKFMKIRTYCTGHNTIKQIADKSKLPEADVDAIIKSLSEIDILHLPIRSLNTLNSEEITHTLVSAVAIWAEQLADTHISRSIFEGKESKNVVIGWLLETYHYIKSFPAALAVAVDHADGELKDVLTVYYKQEKGHESFILNTLIKAGLTKGEVESSIPLISTRTIDLLLRELFSLSPASALLVASILEADGFDSSSAHQVSNNLANIYGFPVDMMEPFFNHVKIDSELGHQMLLENNLHLLKTIESDLLHEIINKLHDIKHAFDLQKLEILDYYNKEGNYIPRQYVDYFAI